MANFTAKDVAALRQITGVGMMNVKRALEKADGDQEKAIAILREEGLAAATKKAGRLASDGIVFSFVEDGVAVVLEVNSETDFVGKNKDFVKFVEDIARTVHVHSPVDVEALKALTIFDGSNTVVEALNEKIHIIGENLSIRRFERFVGKVYNYNHGEGRIGVILALETILPDSDALKSVALDIAMQIAALSPKYISRDEVPAGEIDSEKQILKAQALNEGKPEQIADKMVEGRISKFLENICLLEQTFVKDADFKIKSYLKAKGDELGAEISIQAFSRFEKGEGLEKKEDNFADEVASMMKSE